MVNIDRVTGKIVELLRVNYKADDPKYDKEANLMTRMFAHWLKKEISRILWEETATAEGEQMLKSSPETRSTGGR